MKYLCLVYHDEKQLEALPADEFNALVADTLANGKKLQRSGHEIAAGVLQYVHAATTVRVRGGRVSVTDGPFAETKEQLGGYVLIEARDLNEAIRIAAEMPPARNGSIEVRPLRELTPRDAMADTDETSGANPAGNVSN